MCNIGMYTVHYMSDYYHLIDYVSFLRVNIPCTYGLNLRGKQIEVRNEMWCNVLKPTVDQPLNLYAEWIVWRTASPTKLLL